MAAHRATYRVELKITGREDLEEINQKGADGAFFCLLELFLKKCNGFGLSSSY